MPSLRPTLLALVMTAGSVYSQDDLKAIKATPGETPPGKRLYEVLERQAKTHFDLRRQAVAKLKTPEDIRARQVELRKKFRDALGEMPVEKTPLNARVTRRTKKDGYSVENVVYESRPGFHVTANLYRPEGEGPFPGVLVPCGHSVNGKAAEAYQRISILLAKNGMVSLCFDPMGQGERMQVLDSSGKPAVTGSTTEHTLAGIGAMLVGRSAAGYRLWDAVRSLDYLASRPDVDPKRLGCTGNSGGGTDTAYLMAFDDRVLAAAPSCYITSLERLFATIGPQDAEQNLNGQVALGIEHADYITMRAPKPTLLAVGTQDFFDIDGSWTTFREVKGIYGRLGFGERVELFESDETHGFTKSRREACMRWMRRWLLDKNDAPVEIDFPIATDAELQCTETGQVLTAFHGTSVFEMNAARARELEANRENTQKHRTLLELRNEIRKRLALPKTGAVMHHYNATSIDREGYSIWRRGITSEPGITANILLFRPKTGDSETPKDEFESLRTGEVGPIRGGFGRFTRKPGNGGKPLVVYVGADDALGAPGGPIEARVKAGEWVAMIEPRGTGKSSPVPPSGGGYGHGRFGSDEREAALSFHLNRPLLTQRVLDVIEALSMIANSENVNEFRLIGVGLCGPVALHVAALDNRVEFVEIENAIVSWTDVVNAPVNRGQLSSVVPGVLESYDLPDLAAALALHPPTVLTIRNPVDPSGKALSKADAERKYAKVAAAYAVVNASEKFKLDVK